ncbi:MULTISPECIES: TetR/AcrR family transcriptional regulator [unclassified Streptomyces]|uniref:TetR/AcrR family transcriptional regulator n=1 Tax=unclassified Streptomyces TaxID=2593676 RepID=UPI003810027E
MARRYDPERRQRLIDAAIRVVGERGIAGLSHRAVAAEADVPLGSTTYHFATLDDLLVAALRQCNEAFLRETQERGLLVAGPGGGGGHDDHGDRDDLAAELARFTEETVTRDRPRAQLEYELYLAALRHEALRPVAAEWVDLMADLLSARTDPVTARALAALVDGMCLQALLTGRDVDREEARAIFARVIRTAEGPR